MTYAKARFKMVIATDCFLPRWDGISRFLAEVIPSLAQEYDLTILAPDFGKPLPRFDAKIIRFPVYKFKAGDINPAKPDRKKIAQIVSQSDIVFIQTMGTIGFCAARQACKQKKPAIAFIHSIDWELFSKSVPYGRSLIRFATKFVERKIYNCCRLLLVPSKGVAHIFDDAGITTPKSQVRLGVNIAKFTPSQSKERQKRLANLNPRHIIIGFSGRIAREKDLPTLKAAFDHIKLKHPNAKLLIIGSGLQSEERRIAGDDVIMTGSSENVVPYLQAMDIFVLPSLTETSSLATMEAMACGLPVIATPVGSIRDYINPGENGFLFPKGDAKALATRLEELIDNPGLRQRIGKAARQTAVKSFRWFETSKEIKKAVNKVLDDENEE